MKNKKHKELIILLFAASVIPAIVFKNFWILIPGIVILLAGMLSPYFSLKIFTGWMLFSKYLSKFTTSILLIIVFYFILTPIALMFRLVNRKKESDSKTNRPSYFVENHQQFTPEIFTKPW